MHKPVRDWAPFLAMAFLVVGLVGAYATYAAQIPLERAAARSATLDRDLAAHPAALPRIDAERARMIAEFRRDGEATGLRLRIVLAVFTLAAAVFGVAVLGIAAKAAP